MRTLVLGDIHGRNCWKNIINIENPDFIIFLGDYVTSREKISEEDQIENLKEILAYKEANPDKVILLRGNHDMEAMKYYWAACYPYFESNWLFENKERFLNDTQWIYEIDNVVFSHAGVSKTWFAEVKKYCADKKIDICSLSDINKIEPCELFGFSSNDRYDTYGISKTQPLTWIRPFTLVNDCIEGKIYVVGHTRYDGDILNVVNTVYCCDALPSRYLIYDDSNSEKFIIKEYEMV